LGSLSVSAFAETIGSYSVAAPASAAVVAEGDGAGITTWMTVSGAPATADEAFSGPGIVEDGFANVRPNFIVQMDFAPGVLVNRPGPDLLVVEARFNSGVYALSTVDDGFASEIAVPSAAFANSGLVRSYYYGSPDWGPFAAAIYAAPLDLSALGVPAGAEVSAVRLRAVQSGSDPLGVPAIVPEPAGALLAALSLALLRRRCA
jgi:hypothetical protein